MENISGTNNVENIDHGEIETPNNGAVMGVINPHGKAINAVQHMQQRFSVIKHHYIRAQPQAVAGHMAEVFHTDTFNYDAAIKGRFDIRATCLAEQNNFGPVDIRVIGAKGKTLAEAQVKYNGSASRTADNLSLAKYYRLQRIHPADQNMVEACERNLHHRRYGPLTVQEAARRADELNYAEMLKNSRDRVTAENVQSKPLTYNEARGLVEDGSSVTRKMLQAEMVSAVKGGALIGGAISGSVSLVSNAVKVVKREKEVQEAAAAVVKDTVIGGVDGAAKGAVSVGVKMALFKAGAETLARSTAPIAMAITAVDIGKDVVQAARGKISGKELAERATQKTTAGAVSLAGMEGGAILGTMIMPGPGTIIGGIIGGIAGHVGGSAAFGFAKKQIQNRKRGKL